MTTPDDRSTFFRLLESSEVTPALSAAAFPVSSVQMGPHPTHKSIVYLLLYTAAATRPEPRVQQFERHDLVKLCRMILAELDPTTEGKILATLERIEADLKENR